MLILPCLILLVSLPRVSQFRVTRRNPDAKEHKSKREKLDFEFVFCIFTGAQSTCANQRTALGVGSLLPLCEVWAGNLGHQAW